MLCEPVYWSQKELKEVSYTQVINYNCDVYNVLVTHCVPLRHTDMYKDLRPRQGGYQPQDVCPSLCT